GPAMVLGLLIFVVGGGTGVLMSNEARAAAQSTLSSDLEILMLNWRDARPGDVGLIAESLPDAVVLPVTDGTVHAGSCSSLAQILAREPSPCDGASLSRTLADATGLTAEIGVPPSDATISEVLIGGDPSVSQSTIWRVLNSQLPAVNLFNAAGTDSIRPPLMMSWVLGGVIAGAAILTLAAAHTFGDRLLALGREDECLLRIGLDGGQTRAVQRWTALVPLIPAIGLGFCGAVLFSWAGRFQEFTGLPLLLIALETVAVTVTAAVAAVGVGLIQRRQADHVPS